MTATSRPPAAAGDDRRYDVVVVGGGAIGLATAWTLAARGLAVAVVDPEPGRGASWAAAGMLAPVSEVHHGEEPLLALALAAARQWPAFAAELEAAVGRSVGYRATGTLVVAVDDGDRAWTEELLAFQRDLGLDVQWLSGRAARHLEPGVAPGVRGAIWVADDHQVHTRLLVGALLDAAAGAGAELWRDRAVSLECGGGAVSGVHLAAGPRLRAGCVVLAAGCWSGGLDGLPDGAVPPVRPVKGQILRLTPTGQAGTGPAPVLGRTVRGIVRGASVYLVPRQDGSVVVGATMEERGFDTAVTAGAVYELLRDAHRVVPGVTELVLGEARAGLRPGSPDNAPIVGRPAVAGVDGLVVATGHFRQGILLTPITARAVAAIVDGAEPPAEMAPFGPGRFAGVATRAGP
ncbi:MAG TPA: glycine oxidase ThiO [Acidimicrobiales bacterium]|nr:glycine oxidase ThiO [Acidimicrobiales bacterium]